MTNGEGSAAAAQLVRHPLTLLLTLPRDEIVALLIRIAREQSAQAGRASPAATTVIATPAPGPHLASIRELVMCIASYVPAEERCSMRLVNRSWCQVIDDDYLWRPLLLSEFNIRVDDNERKDGKSMRQLYWYMARGRRDAFRNDAMRRNAQSIMQAGVSLSALNGLLAPWRAAIGGTIGRGRIGPWWPRWG